VSVAVIRNETEGSLMKVVRRVLDERCVHIEDSNANEIDALLHCAGYLSRPARFLAHIRYNPRLKRRLISF
jgi:hypothetical protein